MMTYFHFLSSIHIYSAVLSEPFFGSGPKVVNFRYTKMLRSGSLLRAKYINLQAAPKHPKLGYKVSAHDK